MCELLALNSNVPTAATFSFAGLSARGGLTGDHADGWGMAFHDGEGCRVFIDTGRACDAPLAEFLRQHPPRARTVLAHVRKATQGAVDLANCHPFQRARLLDRDLEVDLSAANAPGDRMAVVATRPLTQGEAWQRFEPGEFRVFSGGRCVWHQAGLSLPQRAVAVAA